MGTHPEIGVDEIDAAGVLLDADLALSGCANLDVFKSEDLGTASFMNPDCRNHCRSPVLKLTRKLSRKS